MVNFIMERFSIFKESLVCPDETVVSEERLDWCLTRPDALQALSGFPADCYIQREVFELGEWCLTEDDPIYFEDIENY